MLKLGSFVYLVCILQCTFASPVDLKPDAKASGEKVVETDKKSAATPEELDSARTHNIYYDNYLLKKLLSPIQQGVAVQPAQIAAPIHTPIYPSYGPLYYPSASYVQSAPVVPVHAPIAAPVAAHVSTPVILSQPAISKPVVSVSQQYSEPAYAVNQQIIHKPHYTEVVEIRRRPVLAEIQEILHRPVVTEYLQKIQRPTYTEHIIKSPSYNTVKQEYYQAPLQLQSEAVHVVVQPSSHVVQLPTQVVKPVPVKVIQTPIYHQPAVLPSVSVPAVSVKPAITSGISYGSVPFYGSGYGLGYGSGYGSSYGYGSGSSSSYGYGSSYLPYSYGYSGLLSGAGHGDYQYITETLSSCRARGDCPKEGNEAKDTTSNYNTDTSFVQVPAPLQNQQFTTPNMFVNPLTYPMIFSYPQSQKAFTPDLTPNDHLKPSQTVETQPSQSAGRNANKQDSAQMLDYVSQKISQDLEIMKKIAQYAEEGTRLKKSLPSDTSPDAKKEVNVSNSIKILREFADKYPEFWSDYYSSDVEQKLNAFIKSKQEGKPTEEKKNA